MSRILLNSVIRAVPWVNLYNTCTTRAWLQYICMVNFWRQYWKSFKESLGFARCPPFNDPQNNVRLECAASLSNECLTLKKEKAKKLLPFVFKGKASCKRSLHILGVQKFLLLILLLFFKDKNVTIRQLKWTRSHVLVIRNRRQHICTIILRFILEKDWHHMAKSRTSLCFCVLHYKNPQEWGKKRQKCCLSKMIQLCN